MIEKPPPPLLGDESSRYKGAYRKWFWEQPGFLAGVSVPDFVFSEVRNTLLDRSLCDPKSLDKWWGKHANYLIGEERVRFSLRLLEIGLSLPGFKKRIRCSHCKKSLLPYARYEIMVEWIDPRTWPEDYLWMGNAYYYFYACPSCCEMRGALSSCKPTVKGALECVIS